MESGLIWVILVFLLILVIIGVAFWLTRNNNPDTTSKSSYQQDDDNWRQSDEVSNDSSEDIYQNGSVDSIVTTFGLQPTIDTGRDSDSLNLSSTKSLSQVPDKIQSLIPQSLLRNSGMFERYQGDLYKSCPCKPGLVCDNGICKQEPGSTCVTSSACHSSMMCYIGRCTEQPRTQDEKQKTNYHDGIVCVNRHFMKLEQDRFIMMKGWWSMNGGISLCDSDVSGLVYMVREDGVTRVSVDPVISGSIEIDQDLSLLKLFRFLGKVYGLTMEGKLYQLPSESLKSKWQYRPVKEIYKKNLSNEVIEDVYPCKDGSLSIRISGKIYTYSVKTKRWTEEIGPKKIVYGETVNTKISLYSDRIKFKFEIPEDDAANLQSPLVHRRQIQPKLSKIRSPDVKCIDFTFTLTGLYKDVELNPEEDGIIVLAANTGHVKEYKPVVWLPLTAGSQNHFRERLLHGSGDRLLRTSNTVWLLTGAKCSQV